MRAGKYNFQELFVNRYVDQIVIPEIQRDYVWEKPQIEGLLSSISDNFHRFQNADVPVIDSEKDPFELKQLNRDFADFYRQRNYSSNIGFIYAYSDQQYEGRYFLIDGQQRVTTLYLVLLLLASRSGLQSDFRKNYCSNKRPKLDYRVRESACSFIRELVPYVLSESCDDIEEQSWYLNSFAHDITVKNILKNLSVVEQWFEKKSINEVEFYQYLNTYTEFWYFDTNISAQGENLYIYLNARGEQVQGNENLKAELLSRLPSIELKNKFGKQWENWQDLFWRKRKNGLSKTQAQVKGLNADKGFNEFLSCISGLQIYLSDTSHSWLGIEKSIPPSSSILSQVLSFEMVEKYISTIKFIEAEKETIRQAYPYSEWIEHCLHEFWGLMNTSQTAWIIDYSNDRLSTERRRMVFVWGVLYWVEQAKNSDKEISTHEVFRGIRQFYLRYKNNMRSVTGISGIKESVRNLLNTGYISNSDGEELKKERWISEIKNQQDSNELESLLWEIEDHPFNIDGADVGLTNSSHLVSFDGKVTVDGLARIKDTFFMCFPSSTSRDNCKLPLIQSLLLYYGKFWRRTSPHYYENYQFNDWRNIIRSRGGNDNFAQLFMELVESGLSVEDFLHSKRDSFQFEKVDSLLEQFRWYNYHLGEKMWDEGSYIALCDFYTENKEDFIFNERRPFLNTKGDFKGGAAKELALLLLPEDRGNY